MMARVLALLGVVLVFAPAFVAAQVPLDGTFVARKVCPATRNITPGDNPGQVTTRVGRSYALLGANKVAATHYLIATRGPAPARRWVAVSCGVRSPAEATTPGDAAPPAHHLLAVSWQPAFCQTHQRKSECASQTAQRFDATHLSLHGLWPQPYGTFYCGVSADQQALDKAGRFADLAALEIAPATRAALERVMPGTRSFLHRHEWTKHGSCFADGDARRYFRASLALMAALNGSRVRDVIAAHIGRYLSARAIRAAFDTAFGKGAGARVAVRCVDGLVTELRIALAGDPPAWTFARHIHAAAPLAAEESTCAGGLIDPAGF